ncbi:hypothetical protein HanPI659440_Chr07g0264751 [Helianthus annuus]|nr:hypothetical protein HanPI659440_Chr07g0264751 [Helianthus annuus]
MPTSTYPKEWKDRFIFASPSLLYESLSIRDPTASVEDGVPPLSIVEDVLWRPMYEYSTHTFNFPEGNLVMGGLSTFYSTHPRTFYDGRGFVNQEMCDVLGGEAPNVEGLNAEAVPGDGTPHLKGASPKGSEGSQNSPQFEDISSGNEDLETRLSQKSKPDLVVGTTEAIPEVQNIRSGLQSTSNKKSQHASQSMFKALPVATKGSLSTHLKILRPNLSFVSGPLLVS